MKLKILINGPRVHNVDYRHFLMNKAIAGSIKMFEAYNLDGETEQQVMIIVDGAENEVDAFRKLVETKRPARAIVSSTVTENYEGEVMRIEEYVKIFATFQIVEKAIPILLEMKDDIKTIKEGVMEIKWEVKDVIGEVKEMNTYVKNLTGM